MSTIKAIYEHRAEIGEAVLALGGAVAYSCTVLAHFPGMPPKWAERFARAASWTSKTFSVNKRPPEATPGNPIAPVEGR